jgi:large subunit ribosomal protein L15
MNINDVNRGIHKHKPNKRLGRGIGSGQGKTAGRGHKGAGSRAGASMPAVFEGGQMPLVRRIPKRGFTNQWAESVAIINVGDLEELFEAGAEVSPATLKSRQIVRGQYDLLKVLGNGELSKGLKISAHRFSKQALDKIQKAGGEAIVLPGKAPVVKNKQRSARKPN